jgi:hypothetical protein
VPHRVAKFPWTLPSAGARPQRMEVLYSLCGVSIFAPLGEVLFAHWASFQASRTSRQVSKWPYAALDISLI